MALRDLITFNRAYGGIQKTVQNISSIRAARQKLEQKKELDDLTIKEKKLNIQKQSMANEMTQMEQGFLESQLKELEKVSKAETTAISGKIDIAEIGEKAKLGQLQDFAKVTGSRLDDNDMAVLMGLSSGEETQPEYSRVAGRLNPNLPSISYKRKIGPFTVSTGKKKTTMAVDKVLGNLDVGSSIQGGYEIPFETKEDAEKYASRNLGYNWEKKYPKAVEMIKEKFPEPKGDLTQGIRTGTVEGMADTVLIELPDGRQGNIPKDKLDEALKRGATVIR